MPRRQKRKPQDQKRKKLRKAKRAGISRERAIEIVTENIHKTAREEGWLPSQEEVALADWAHAIQEVYGNA